MISKLIIAVVVVGLLAMIPAGTFTAALKPLMPLIILGGLSLLSLSVGVLALGSGSWQSGLVALLASAFLFTATYQAIPKGSSPQAATAQPKSKTSR